MVKIRKRIREKGKTRLSEYFKALGKGDKVSIIKDAGQESSFPDRIQGRTGVIEEKRGKAYLVRMMDFNEEKRYLIQPVHLKKLASKN